MLFSAKVFQWLCRGFRWKLNSLGQHRDLISSSPAYLCLVCWPHLPISIFIFKSVPTASWMCCVFPWLYTFAHITSLVHFYLSFKTQSTYYLFWEVGYLLCPHATAIRCAIILTVDLLCKFINCLKDNLNIILLCISKTQHTAGDKALVSEGDKANTIRTKEGRKIGMWSKQDLFLGLWREVE